VGNHTVSLTVTDNGGATATDEILVRVLPMGGGEPTILEVRVNSGSDDAEERTASGSVGLTSSDLEMIDDKTRLQIVGMRFVGVTIPPGATIVNAWVQFQADETDNIATSLTIEAEASANPVTFSTSNGNISSRPRLPVSVPWSPVAWNTVNEQGPGQRTPDLAPLIQEVVKQQNWSSGNSLVLIISGSGKRVADSYNGNQNGAPLLHVEFL
jgi:PKD repeat protein